mgnify:CR=1 FL=1
MKKLILKIAIFILIVLGVDRLTGALLKEQYFSLNNGRYYRLDYIINKSNSKCLIFGSSHATTHFNPEIMENITGLSFYNGGVQGQGIIFSCALIDLVLERYSPEIILFNLDKGYLVKSDDYKDRLSELLPFYQNNNALTKYIKFKGKNEKIKLLSKTYPYNSKIVNIIYYKYFNQPDIKGYRALKDTICINDERLNYLKQNKIIDTLNKPIDTIYVNVFNDIINQCRNKNIKLIFIISPEFYISNLEKTNYFEKLMNIVNCSNYELWDYSKDTSFCYHRDLFNDGTHLNEKGATAFSSIIAKRLMENN